MNLRSTIFLFSLLPSTAAANDIKHDDTNNIRGAVPSPSSINMPTPRTLLTPSVSDDNVNRRLGKPTGCKKNCPSPTTTTTTTTTTTIATPSSSCPSCLTSAFGSDVCQCANNIGNIDWSSLQCNPPTVAERSPPVFTNYITTPSVATPGNQYYACYDGSGGYYRGDTLRCYGYLNYFGTICCPIGEVWSGVKCIPLICDENVTPGECGTAVSTTTQATIVGSTTTTTTTMVQTTTITAATDSTTTANVQCAKQGDLCKGKDSKPCCQPLFTCGQDKKCH